MDVQLLLCNCFEGSDILTSLSSYTTFLPFLPESPSSYPSPLFLKFHVPLLTKSTDFCLLFLSPSAHQVLRGFGLWRTSPRWLEGTLSLTVEWLGTLITQSTGTKRGFCFLTTIVRWSSFYSPCWNSWLHEHEPKCIPNPKLQQQLVLIKKTLTTV